MNSFYGNGDGAVGNGISAAVGGGERVRVAMRVRPMMPHEFSRGDDNIITTPDN